MILIVISVRSVPNSINGADENEAVCDFNLIRNLSSGYSMRHLSKAVKLNSQMAFLYLFPGHRK
jgi:hypothetical protein